MNYLYHLSIVISIYIIMGLSLNLALGYGGLLSLCQAAFQGVGAYAATLLVMKAGWGFLPAAGVAVLGTGVLAFLVAVPTLRFKGDYFVLATMAFQIIVFTVLNNLVDLTQGPYGIAGIPKPNLFGWQVRTLPSFALFSATAAILVTGLCWQLTRSPYGRTLRAIRDDELAASSLGKDPWYFKSTAFVLAGGLAAVAGVIHASYITFIEPTNFGLAESLFVLVLVIVGGTGSLTGPIVGSVFMVLLPEILRFVRVPDAAAADLRQIIYGVLLIVVIRIRPRGIAGRYALE